MLTLQLTLDNGQVTVRANERQSHSFSIRDLNNTDLKNFVNDPKPYGEKLFQALFKDDSEARKAFDELSKHSERTIVLVLESSELDGIAWEYAYHDNAYIVEDFAFIRALPEKERPHINGRLSKSVERVPLLLIPANPLVDLSGEPMRELDIESEWHEMKQFIEKSNAPFDLIELRPATPAALQSVMARFQNGMIAHFSGHGAATKEGAFLLFENENGSSNPLEAREFVREVKDQAWIGFLSACQSAVAERTEYSNLARELVKAGVPFALGMQFNLPDPFASNISGQFYNYLSEGHAVPEAARQARRAVKRENEFYVGMIALYAAHPDEAGKMGWTGSGARALTMFTEADVSDLPTPSGFIGRQRELMNIGTSLLGKKKPNTVTLHGAGGIGKTALMRQVLLRFAPSFESVIAIALDPLPSRESVLGRLERFLNLPSPCANDTKEREQIVRKKLAGRETLLGLDNFETLIHARDNGSDEEKKTAKSLYTFFKSLAAEEVTLCVTSREKTSLPGETIQEIHGLEDEIGGRLFQNTVSTRRDALNEMGMEKLSAAVGGHPLALRLLAPIFEEQAGLLLEQFIEKLQTFLPKASDQWTELERHESLSACFAFSMDNFPKTEEGDRLQVAVSRLSVFTAFFVDFTATPVLENHFPENEEEGEQTTIRVQNFLHMLWERSLLERVIIPLKGENLNLYRVHPSLRPFARKRLKDVKVVEENYWKSMSNLARIAAEEINSNMLVVNICLTSIPDLLIAAELKNNEDAAFMQLRLGKIFYQFGRYDDALRLLWRSHAIYQDANYPIGEGSALAQIASILFVRGNYEEAIDQFERLMISAEQAGDLQGKVGLLNWIASVEEAKNNVGKAFSLYQEAFDIADRIEYDQGKASSLNSIANIHFVRGNLDAAMDLFEQAFEIDKKLDDTKAMASVLHRMAGIFTIRDELDTAMQYYQIALNVFEELGDIQGKSDTSHEMAHLYKKKGDFDAALRLYQQSYEIDKNLGNLQGEATALSSMADIYIERNELSIALNMCQESLEIREKLGDLKGKASSLFKIATIHAKNLNVEEAIKNYQQSLTIDNELDDIRGVSAAMSQIGSLLFYSKRYSLALKYLINALVNLEKINASSDAQSVANLLFQFRQTLGEKEFDNLWREEVNEPIPGWLKQDGLTIEQFVLLSIQAAHEKRPEAEEYFKEAQRLAIDSNSPAELQVLGKVLQHIMIGEKNVDLSTLTDGLREMVEKALQG